MLCSSSGSGWLDRLRKSKGFPIPSDGDLDGYLSSLSVNEISEPNPNPNPNPNPSTNAKGVPNPKPEARAERMASLLADLFVMGRPPPKTQSKASRKQQNTRFFPQSPAQEAVAVAGDSFSEARKRRGKLPRRKRENKGPSSSDMSAYSCTEVTVIDTSIQGWKAEKAIFRRGSMWKIRDKKVVCGWRKKHKSELLEKLAKEKAPCGLQSKDPAHANKKDSSKETYRQKTISERRQLH